MRLKFQEIVIDDVDPFKFDVLGRKEEVENLSTLVSQLSSPAVIAINSKWGTGKTTFINLWHQHLKSKGYLCLKFSAWETDFSEDPLVSFISEIDNKLSNLKGFPASALTAWNKTVKIGKKLLKNSIPVAVRLGTGGLLDIDKAYEEELAKFGERMATEALDSYTSQKNSLEEFKTSLSKVISLSDNEGPLVLFVDELDRCRPLYAISLLERIKHLFSIEGVVFVLSLDKEQLSHSISSVYGQGIDANSYLRRFLDLEYNLRSPNAKNFVTSLFDSLLLGEYFETLSTNNQNTDEKKRFIEIFSILATYGEFTLREIEQLMVSINLAFRSSAKTEYANPVLLTYLVILKNKYQDIYRNYIDISTDEIAAVDHFNNLVPFEVRVKSEVCAQLESLILGGKGNPHNDFQLSTISKHRNLIEDDKTPRNVRMHSEYVLRLFGNQRIYGVNLEKLIARIEFVSRFSLEE